MAEDKNINVHFNGVYDQGHIDIEYTNDPEWYTYYHSETGQLITTQDPKTHKQLICAKPTKAAATKIIEESIELKGSKYPCLHKWTGPIKIKDLPKVGESQDPLHNPNAI